MDKKFLPVQENSQAALEKIFIADIPELRLTHEEHDEDALDDRELPIIFSTMEASGDFKQRLLSLDVNSSLFFRSNEDDHVRYKKFKHQEYGILFSRQEVGFAMDAEDMRPRFFAQNDETGAIEPIEIDLDLDQAIAESLLPVEKYKAITQLESHNDSFIPSRDHLVDVTERDMRSKIFDDKLSAIRVGEALWVKSGSNVVRFTKRESGTNMKYIQAHYFSKHKGVGNQNNRDYDQFSDESAGFDEIFAYEKGENKWIEVDEDDFDSREDLLSSLEDM